MGAWGYNNFESDSALQALEEKCQSFYDKIIELLKNPLSCEYDETEHYELFALVEIILALEKNEMVYFSGDLSELKTLSKKFFEGWKTYYDDLDVEPCVERGKVIKISLEKLAEIVEEYT